MTELNDIGWSEFFQNSLQELPLKGVDTVLGRISGFNGSHYTVLTKDGEIRARASSRVMNEIYPTVGDWAVVMPAETHKTIIKVLERSGHISRKAAGSDVREQPVAANVDLIFIVMGLDHDFNVRRLERYLAMAASSGASPVILLNKADSADDLEEMERFVEDVAGDVPYHSISALDGDGLEVVRTYLKKGITGVLVGSSGVGKSTLMNSLLGEERQKTLKVRQDDNKGRHATTSRELIPIPGGSVLIDNPGIRELQLWGDPSMVDDAFQDIKRWSESCRFKDCGHISEPGCRVLQALRSGKLNQSRYDNYLKLQRELRHLATKTDKGARRAEKEKWRGIMKDVKHYYKYKRERS